MKLLKTTLCAAAATIAMTGAASALEVSYNIGGATDYVFRGVDQTTDDSEIQIFGGVDVTEGSFYGGAWLSNVGYNFDGVEYDLYAGWKPDLGGATLDLGVIYYGYTNSATTSSDTNTWEAKAAASVPVGAWTLGAAAYYSPDLADSDESSLYIEANAAYAINDTYTVSGAYGQWSSDAFQVAATDPDSYSTWNVGVTAKVAENFTLDGRYVATDSDAAAIPAIGPLAYKGLVATIKMTF